METKQKITPIILGKLDNELTFQEKEIYQKLNPLGFILYARNLYKNVFKPLCLCLSY